FRLQAQDGIRDFHVTGVQTCALPIDAPDFVWEIDNLHKAPEDLRDLADHARRFSIVIHGAALMYNLLLARRRGDDDLAGGYVEQIGRAPGRERARRRQQPGRW